MDSIQKSIMNYCCGVEPPIINEGLIDNHKARTAEKALNQIDKLIEAEKFKLKNAKNSMEELAAKRTIDNLEKQKTKLMGKYGNSINTNNKSNTGYRDKYKNNIIFTYSLLSILNSKKDNQQQVDYFNKTIDEWKKCKDFDIDSLYDMFVEAIPFFKVSANDIDKYFQNQKAKGKKSDSVHFAKDLKGDPLEKYFNENELWELIGDGAGNIILYDTKTKKCYEYDHESSYKYNNLGTGIPLSKVISDANTFYNECKKITKGGM